MNNLKVGIKTWLKETKLSPVDSVFFTFLIIGLLIRLNGFYSITYTEDGSRDFLVAHHILKYHEFPLTGPATNFEPIKSSPLYFYVLSILLLIKDSYVFLGLANLLLQILTIIFIYLLAKKMFDGTTALIASTLFNFSQAIMTQSNFLWQPWFAQPFANLSYLLLFLSYSKKSFRLLIFCAFTFIIAGVLHRSNFLLSPLFLFLTAVILKRYIRYAYKYAILVVCLLFLIILLNLPLLIYYAGHPTNLPLIANNISQSSSTLALFNSSLSALITNLFLLTPGTILNLNYQALCLFIVGLTILALLRSANHAHTKNYLVILIIAVISQIILVSGLKSDIPRYLTPILGIFIILLSAAINLVFSKNIPLNIVKIILLALIINLTTPNLFTQIVLAKKALFTKKGISNPAVMAVEKKILSIQKEEKLPNLNFFDFKSIKDGHDYGYVDAAFWATLESDLNVKLVELDYSNTHSYRTMNSDTYIFLICYNYQDATNEENSCRDAFTEKSKYKVIENFYSKFPFSIYLTEKPHDRIL